MTGDDVNDDEIERLATLLRLIPPAPQGWVEAAQELPALQRLLDDLVARVEADADFRRAALADLESAVAAAGVAPDPRVIEALRARLHPG